MSSQPPGESHAAKCIDLYRMVSDCSTVFGKLSAQLSEMGGFTHAAALCADMVIVCDAALAKARGQK